MNSNDGFKLLSSSEKTIDYINKQLVNFPKKEVVLKQNIETLHAIAKELMAKEKINEEIK